MEIIIAILAAISILVLSILYSSFAWGYVASVLYNWFLLSNFTELPVIYWWQFAGIMFFVNCFIHHDTHQFKEEIKDPKNGVITSLLQPWGILLGAWIFKTMLY